MCRRRPAQDRPGRAGDAGIDFQAVRERLQEKFGPGALEHPRSGCLGVTPPTKQALALALDHADGQPLGDERSLLGMLTVPDSLAAQLLGKLGVFQHAAEAIVTRRDAELGGRRRRCQWRWLAAAAPASGPGRRPARTFAEARAAVLARTGSRGRGGTGPPRRG